MSAWKYRRTVRLGKPAIEATCSLCRVRRFRTWYPEDAMPHGSLFGEHTCSAAPFVNDLPVAERKWDFSLQAEKRSTTIFLRCTSCRHRERRTWRMGNEPIFESALPSCPKCASPQSPMLEHHALVMRIARGVAKLIRANALPPELLALVTKFR